MSKVPSPLSITTKLWFKTHRLARIASAISGESLVSFYHRVVKAETDRMGIDDLEKELNRRDLEAQEKGERKNDE